jgi:hypothetical protein
MDKFYVTQDDPERYRDEIIRFWDEYLPGTPHGRFEWMKRGNPAGAAAWFFAIDRETNDLAGMISVIPKEVLFNGSMVRGGILGDFMISSKYRVFGPNLLLPRAVMARLTELGFAFLYTVPNPQSKRIIDRVGFKRSGTIRSFVKPLNTRHYLSKYGGPLASRLLSPFMDAGLKVLSRETYISSSGFFEEILEPDESFDLFWDAVKRSQANVTGDHSARYLTWRYLHDPLYRFRVLACREHAAGRLLGYIIFAVEGAKMHIFDIVTLNRVHVSKLLKSLARIGKNENCLSICIDLIESNPICATIRSFGFYDAKKSVPLASYGGHYGNLFEKYNFFSGDSNI